MKWVIPALIALFSGCGGADIGATDGNLPTFVVEANYPSANAQVVADTVAAPLEQQINGISGMVHLRSQCRSDGSDIKRGTQRVFREGWQQNALCPASLYLSHCASCYYILPRPLRLASEWA